MGMENEMIERVAKAILERDPDMRTIEARRIARTAVEAMRVPTMDMIIQATEEWLCIRAQEDRAEVIWDAMIDSALGNPRKQAAA